MGRVSLATVDNHWAGLLAALGQLALGLVQAEDHPQLLAGLVQDRDQVEDHPQLLAGVSLLVLGQEFLLGIFVWLEMCMLLYMFAVYHYSI
jgi:hypothetical protein